MLDCCSSSCSRAETVKEAGKRPIGRCLVKFSAAGPHDRLRHLIKKPIHFLSSAIKNILCHFRVMCTHTILTLQHWEICIFTCQLYHCMHKPVQLHSVHPSCPQDKNWFICKPPSPSCGNFKGPVCSLVNEPKPSNNNHSSKVIPTTCQQMNEITTSFIWLC